MSITYTNSVHVRIILFVFILFLFANVKDFDIQYRPASLSIDPAFRASACTNCEYIYIECTIAIIIIVILVRSLFLVDIMCSFG